MATYLLVLYLSTAKSPYATGGPLVVDDISSHAACEKIAEQLKSRVGNKYGWHICQEVTK